MGTEPIRRFFRNGLFSPNRQKQLREYYFEVEFQRPSFGCPTEKYLRKKLKSYFGMDEARRKLDDGWCVLNFSDRASAERCRKIFRQPWAYTYPVDQYETPVFVSLTGRATPLNKVGFCPSCNKIRRVRQLDPFSRITGYRCSTCDEETPALSELPKKEMLKHARQLKAA